MSEQVNIPCFHSGLEEGCASCWEGSFMRCDEELQTLKEDLIEILGDIQFDGAHHKTWVGDQATRRILGNKYEEWVEEYRERDADGEPQYQWDEGIAP